MGCIATIGGRLHQGDLLLTSIGCLAWRITWQEHPEHGAARGPWSAVQVRLESLASLNLQAFHQLFNDFQGLFPVLIQ